MSARRVLGVVVVSAAAVAGLTQIGAGAHGNTGRVATGLVVDDAGEPVAGASVSLGTTTTRTGADGRFALAAAAAGIAEVAGEGYLGRAQVLDPAVPARVELTRAGADAVSLRFGGDAMMGRRFYEQRDGAPALLSPGSSAAQHAALLAEVEPLLADADLTVLNLETPLVEDPVVERDGVRVSDVHPTKDLVIASSTAMAEGLRLAGVDVVSLGNNHAADALGPGISTTEAALDAAGIAHFGAGDTPDDAWRPAYVQVHGTTVAFLGCTTVTGRRHAVPYVATATNPGAAECESTRLGREVRAARQRADVVVVMIHGHVEYRRSQGRTVRDLAAAAGQAGAAVVVGSHPHVVGGLTSVGGAVFAESMGNIVFDQELWETLPTYVARVDIRGGRAVSTSVDPVLLDGYRPRPAVGALADAVARIAAGTVPGDARLDPAGAHLSAAPAGPGTTAVATLDPGVARSLAPGWWVGGEDGVRVGADLLFGTGGFGDVAVGQDGGAERLWSIRAGDTPSGGPERLWALGRYARTTSAAGCVPEGGSEDDAVGLELARSPLSTKDVIATVEHRAPVTAGERLTLLADVRRAGTGAVLEVRWYPAMSGPSAAVSTLEVPEGRYDPTSCRQVRLDVTVPAGMVGAQVFARVRAPHGGQTLRYLGVDDIRLVVWQPAGEGGRRFDVVESPAGGPVTVTRDDARGGPDRPFR